MCKELRTASRREMKNSIESESIVEHSDGNVVEILGEEERVASKSTGVSTHADDSRQKKSVDRASTTKLSNWISNDLAADSPSSESISHPRLAGQSPSINCPSSKTRRKVDPKWTFSSVYKSGPVPLDPKTSSTWIYPRNENFPLRQYQLEISETAVNFNCLVSIPTGIGKTLIASVVLYNYYRWFPQGKMIFLAPTLPLVTQQAQACYSIMGIPGIDTAVLTGRIKPSTRFDLWRSRRMFYCTPQTVQKDLLSDDATFFASRVCCVVLDEAHKASGDYAYTKVIEQLELAGAQFRIVGLSATPGTSIKAIQKVVESLRAVKIEARYETDPSVAPYVHQKHSEIVIVPKNESQKDIERRLTRMLEPILQYLKAHGALKFGGGNATVTTFQIHKSCQEYLKSNRNASGSVRAYFQAAYKLIELRNDAYQSLGCVKLKIQRLKQTPQKGPLAKLIRSKDFDDLYRRVLNATNSAVESKTSSDLSVESFNPKLQKLAELLNEHFSRAKAAEKSSRAIVFSQFRDSVSEIVEQLKKYHPLVRARHFVGQQSSKRSVGDVDNRLGGMKQSEQQQVIKWFRENVYNVLVCTCIGEEGLDIGEVDLIVNFDTLRSPIRMIQRTGRTGRKRNGRVVCLISEGQEERTYKASKQAEQTLMIALKKCGSFKMEVHKPMLPREPTRQFADIKITGSFRFSQVGHSAPRRQTKVQNWNLGPAQEEERGQLLGKVISANSDWTAVRAVLLRGWCGSFRANIRGQSTQLLHKLKGIRPVKAKTMSRRSLTCGIESIFPIVPPHDQETKPARIAKPPVQMPLNGHEKTHASSHLPNAPALRKLGIPNRRDEIELTKSRSHSLNGVEKKVCERQEATALFLEENQFRRSNTESSRIYEKILVSNSNHDAVPQPTFRLPTPPPSSYEEDSDMPLEGGSFCFRLPTQDSSSSEEEGPTNCLPLCTSAKTHEPTYDEMDNVKYIPNFQVSETHYGTYNDQSELSNCRMEELRPGSLRHSETDDSDARLISLKRRTDEKTEKRKAENIPLMELKRQRKILIEGMNAGCGRKSIATSEMEDSMMSANTFGDAKMSPSAILGTNSGDMDSETGPGAKKVGNKRQSTQENDPASRWADPPIDNALTLFNKPLGVSKGHSLNSSQVRSHTADRSVGKRCQRAALELSLDCLTCGKSPRRHDRTPKSNARTNWYGELTDTPDYDVNIDPEDINCALCRSVASTDENPIFLCDGRCNRAFHKLCYSIESDIKSADPWLCKECSRAKEPLLTKRIIKRSAAGHISTKDNEVVGRQIHGCDRDNSKVEVKKKRLEVLQARRLGAARFVFDEADIEANDDMEGDDAENDMLEALEEEESIFNDGFINDSTQLSQHYSDDELGNVDPDASRDINFHHRNLDAQFDRKNQFITPVLNRRGCGLDLSAASSQEGLGNMHFIRSVLHHHQQGGDAQEIEDYFRDLQSREQTPGESSSVVHQSDNDSPDKWRNHQ